MPNTQTDISQTNRRLVEKHPALVPRGALIWTALVDVADRIDLGASAKGHRYMVPILGGTFHAGSAGAGMSGTVLPGGADRQLLRPDGVKELEAVYEMQTTDGTILSIRNHVVVDEARTPIRYAMSVIEVAAPDGPFAWLNRRLIVGTLQSARPARAAVIIRAWLMDVPSAI